MGGGGLQSTISNGQQRLNGAICLDSNDCTIWSSQKLAALIGISGLIVVDTPDAIMICRKDRAQVVTKLLDELAQKGYDHLL